MKKIKKGKKFTKAEINKVKAAWEVYKKSLKKVHELYVETDRHFLEGYKMIAEGEQMIVNGKESIRIGNGLAWLAEKHRESGQDGWGAVLADIGACSAHYVDGLCDIEGIGTFKLD